jgi:hypothetical protein
VTIVGRVALTVAAILILWAFLLLVGGDDSVVSVDDQPGMDTLFPDLEAHLPPGRPGRVEAMLLRAIKAAQTLRCWSPRIGG